MRKKNLPTRNELISDATKIENIKTEIMAHLNKLAIKNLEKLKKTLDQTNDQMILLKPVYFFQRKTNLETEDYLTYIKFIQEIIDTIKRRIAEMDQKMDALDKGLPDPHPEETFLNHWIITYKILEKIKLPKERARGGATQWSMWTPLAKLLDTQHR